MKRRTFIEALAIVPAAGATALAQTPPPAPPQGAGPAPGQAPGGPGQAPGQSPAPGTPDPIAYANSNVAAEGVTGFFTPVQFAALARLGRLFHPSTSGTPGSVDAGAAEFLDFYVGRSPAARQTMYRTGLDGLNARAQQKFTRAFGDTDDAQADAIVMEVLSRPWSYAPSDPIEAFVRTAQLDFRRAVQNSQAAAATMPSPPMTNWLRPL